YRKIIVNLQSSVFDRMDPVKIVDFSVFRFSLPLVIPLSVKGSTLRAREGLIIRLQTSDQLTGWGEVAPLPGFSQETLSEVLASIGAIRLKILNQEIPEDVIAFKKGLNAWLEDYALYPSLRFGLEMAILNLLTKSLSLP